MAKKLKKKDSNPILPLSTLGTVRAVAVMQAMEERAKAENKKIIDSKALAKVGVDAVIEGLDDFQKSVIRPVVQSLYDDAIKVTSPYGEVLKGLYAPPRKWNGGEGYKKKLAKELRNEPGLSSISDDKFNELVEKVYAAVTEKLQKEPTKFKQAKQKKDVEKVSKKGPRKYSDEDKLKALEDWDKFDKRKHPINVQDWLIEKFGEDGGIPKVPKSTFYGWNKLRKD